MFYILHGTDALSRGETVAALKARLFEADAMAELNYNELDGRRLTLGDLQATVEALPFMGDRRMVVVRGLLERCNPRGKDAGRKALSDGIKQQLGKLPPSTRLVLVEHKLHGNNPVLKWAKTWLASQPAPDTAAMIRAFDPPRADRLPKWLERRAISRGGSIDSKAASALADALIQDRSVDLGQADNELEKLLTYAKDRPVTSEDVSWLVTPVSLDSIFDFIDTLARRDGPSATNMLHRFLDQGEPPLRILALVARQFRLLTMTRAMEDLGTPQAEMRGQLSVPPFVVSKLRGQARQFSPRFLESALRRLRDIDSEIKTGRIDPVLALDLLVAGVCGVNETALR